MPMTIPAIDRVEALLTSYGRFGIELGLERIQHLLERLGNPQQVVPIVHVAGTNGKGSVCAYLSAVLSAAGYRTGCYTSPHLVSWCDRICINQQPIAAATLLETLETAAAAADPQLPPTQFELFTAAMWLHFARQAVDIAIVEVGLGGRLDATNVCPEPLVTVITSLSREHWQRLGPTLAHIAFEKAGILKAERPAVIGALPQEAAAVVRQRLQALRCPSWWPEPAQETVPGVGLYQPVAETALAGLTYPLVLPGAHQRLNSALAIATAERLIEQGWQISRQTTAAGLAATRWPGRLEWVLWRGQPWLVDGAHNPAAAAVLRAYVDRLPPQNTTWVMGLLATKDHGDIFQALLRPGDRLHLVPVPGHEAAELGELVAIATQTCPALASIHPHPSIEAALEAVHQLTDPPDLRVLCGSLYLIGHLFAAEGPLQRGASALQYAPL